MFFLQKLENSATEALKDALPQVLKKTHKNFILCICLNTEGFRSDFSTFFAYCVLPLPLDLLFRFLKKRD